LKRVNLKDELRYLFEYRRKERADRQAMEEYQREEGHKAGKIEGHKEGKIEGHKEGKIEGKIETAKNLKAMGIAIEQIMLATGLTADEISKL
jgi:predicted transposase/invertase (TIGR01784 family)